MPRHTFKIQAKTLKKYFLLALIIFCSSYSISQTLIPRFENLGVNDGLAHSSVYSITQDQRGFIWFGTPNGLCRYDGSNLKSFQFKGSDKNGTANNFVRGNLVEDKFGNIWYSNENGIYKWDALSERVNLIWQPDKAEFDNSEFRSLYLDDGGFLWLINVHKGIIRFDINSKNITQYKFPVKIDYWQLKYTFANFDTKGNIWMKVGSKMAPIVIFNTRSLTFSIENSFDPPNSIFFSKNEKVSVYKNKLEFYNENRDTIYSAMPGFMKHENINFREGVKDSFGRWWITTIGNGLVCYDEKSRHFTEFHHDNLKLKSLPFNLTTCVYIDRSNNLWIGTDGGGVARLNLKQPKFNLFPLSVGDYPELKDYFTKCFFEDEKGRIWFGTHSNGLNIYDPVTRELVNYKNDPNKKYSLPGNVVGAIFRDKDKNIWIGSNHGISLFNEKKNLFIPVTLKNILFNDLPDRGSFVFKITQLQNGEILCATTYGILKIIKDESGLFKGASTGKNYLRSGATDVLEMQDGKIYVSRPSLGILQLRPDGETFDSLNNFLPGIDLRSISKDEKNKDYLWVSSGIGLIHFNTISQAFKVYNENDGLGDNFVYGVLQDSVGNLWISTNKGLSFFNTVNNKFDNYSHLDGLQSNEFNTQAFYKSASGKFYFGGINGFNWFEPEVEKKEKVKPLVAITSIEINNIKFNKDSNYILRNTISVPYNKNYFNFQFAALDYTRPEANRVQYILEGWDVEEITSLNKSARYANLPPGNYTLRVKVSNGEGTWSDEQKLQIIINAPFWKTGLFQLSVALVLLSSIIYVTYILSRQKVKRKMQLLEKQIAVDAERLRISTDMHDEIGSGITRIALMSELIQMKQKDKNGLTNEIKTISTSAHRLVQTMSEIIWALNPQNDTLENLLAYIREQSQQYLEPFDIQFDINFPDEVPRIILTNEERRNLYLVTKELLNNAMKHSEASVISLCFGIRKNQLCFTVSDNGIGLQPKKIKEGSNGIRNLKKRMKDIKGSIEWEKITQGTEVNYTMPLKNGTTISTLIHVF